MQRWTVHLLILVMLASSIGCMSRRYRSAGDDAFAQGNMRSAVYNYERALGHRESLAENDEFMSNLAFARSRVAYDDALRLQGEGHYEQSIEKLEEALVWDPTYEAPAQRMAQVRGQASVWRYERALEAANENQMTQAGEHLRDALQHDPTNAQATQALASLTPETLPADTPGLDAYRRGVALSAERQWAQAESALFEASRLNVNLLPARSGLHTARAELGRSRDLSSRGGVQLTQRRLVEAIGLLNQALEVWPNNEEASGWLERAESQRAEALAFFASSNQAAAQGDWDAAIAHADSGIAIDQSDRPLRDLRDELPGRAAAYYTRQGDSHLNSAELDEAFAAYHRSLGYVGTYRDARRGLARVYTAWGAELEGDGRIGAAYLHYRRARSLADVDAAQEGVARLTGALRARIDMGLGVAVGNNGRSGISADMVGSALTNRLARTRGLTLNADDVPYVLDVTIRQSNIDQRPVGSSNRSHHYTTCELRHNPEYDRVAHDLQCAQADLSRMRADLHRYRCRGGHPHGSPCDCYNHGLYNSLRSRIHRQECLVDDLARRLRRTPRQIEVTINHTWPYTIETHRVTGLLEVQSVLIDTASRDVVSQTNHRANFSASDDQILNANPSVGLGYDRLNLPSDAHVRAELTTDLARESGGWALGAAVNHRIGQLNARAATLETQGNAAEALEARVDAAFLQGMSNPGSSERRLQELIDAHTR